MSNDKKVKEIIKERLLKEALRRYRGIEDQKRRERNKKITTLRKPLEGFDSLQERSCSRAVRLRTGVLSNNNTPLRNQRRRDCNCWLLRMWTKPCSVLKLTLFIFHYFKFFSWTWKRRWSLFFVNRPKRL